MSVATAATSARSSSRPTIVVSKHGLLRAYVIARDPVRIVAETSEYARATFCESGKFKRQIGVMGLADLCLAPEGQTGNPAVAELETHHAELQSRTRPNYAGGPS
jgi:hypothetical protein